ncbi:hypothetical protein ABW20_dc0101456 [Dactylellina cionopaga]|nr:hypothetical protein ABW20_dc0101456 [Dactylellina cionopaga]
MEGRTLSPKHPAYDSDLRVASTSRKENMPKSQKITQANQKKASGLRVTARGSSKLVTQKSKQARSGSRYSEQSDEDGHDSEILEAPDDSEVDTIPLSKPRSHQHPPKSSLIISNLASAKQIHSPTKQVARGEMSTIKTVETSEISTLRKGLGVENSTQGKSGRRRFNRTNPIAVNPDAEIPFSFQVPPSDGGAQEESILPNTVGTGSGTRSSPSPSTRKNPSNSKNRLTSIDIESIFQDETIDAVESNVVQKKRAGRPKKIAKTSELQVLPATALVTEQVDYDSLKVIHGSPAALGSNSIREEQDRPIQTLINRNLSIGKRGRKRKAESLAPEKQRFSEGQIEDSVPLSRPATEVINDNKQGRKNTSPTNQVVESDYVAGTGSSLPEIDRPQRSRIAPLQFWKNEKRVYKVNERRDSGTAVSLSEQVVRVEDTPVTKPKRRPRPRAQVPSKKAHKRSKIQESQSDDESEQSESDDEDWEKTGKLVGVVRQWSSENGDVELDEIEDGE